jgi:putative FmdB family regulatory protein
MPTYEYACTECGERLEAVQSFTDDPLTVCPACEGRLRKLFSPVGVVFKGSGFYKTDSRDKGKVGAGSTKKSADSADGSSATSDSSATQGAGSSKSASTSTSSSGESTGSTGTGSSGSSGDGSKVA